MKDSVILWLERHTMFDIEEMKNTDDDFQGERMCNPASSKDVLFDRDILNGMETREPVKEIAGFKIYKLYDPSHRYGSGHDIAGGLGLDSSTSVFIDFSLNPAQVVATFANNTIKPDVMGDEINRQANIFGNSITGIEKNNHGHATIARCRQLGTNLYQTQGKQIKIENSSPTEYGWQTNGLTKSKMLFDLKKAIEDGLLVVPDKDLVQELKSYSRNDLLDDEKDPRLTTRHFDILIALAIAYQMKDFADIKKDNEYIQEDYKPMYDDIGI